MYTRLWLLAGLLGATLLAGQEPPPSVEVTGAVKQRLTLTSDDLAKMPRASARKESNGIETVYEGVWLDEILLRK